MLAGCAGVQGLSRPPSKKNVVFIAVDDLNTWIGCLSHLREGVPEAQTPNIDKLASQGMLFTNAHTPVPWCMPARNNTLTGLYPNHSQIYSDELFRDFLPNIKTLPQHFKESGYYLMAGGKIFHDTYPEAESWHEFNQFIRSPEEKKRLPSLTGLGELGGGQGEGLDWGVTSVSEHDLTDYKIAQWGIERLTRDYDTPFFLALGFRFPHLPWYLPQEYLDRYPMDSISVPWVKEDDLDDIPNAGKKMAWDNPFLSASNFEQSDYAQVKKTNNWKRGVQAYLAAITFVDKQIGRVLEVLDQSKKKSDTLVVLWSDNGFHLGEKLHWRKFTLWDQATRVPVIIRDSSIAKPGRQVNTAVSLVDIYPTLLDLCGLAYPKHKLSGESLLPILAGRGLDAQKKAYITYGKGNDSIVDAKWRYIQYADGTEELYDHMVDPQEWINLVNKKEYQGILMKMRKSLVIHKGAV